MKSIPTTKASAVRLLRAHLLAACLAASMSAPAMAGDPVPSVAACASEADPGKRLACYDRASGRDHGNAPPPAAVAPPPAPLPAPPAAAAAPAPPAVPSSAKVPKHLTARVVSIEQDGAGFVLHLDNGQVWQHVDSTPTAVDLKAGDQVTLDRSLGSYWLAGRYGPAVQVAQKREPSAAP